MQHLSDHLIIIIIVISSIIIIIIIMFWAHRQTISIVASGLLLFFSTRLLARSFTAIVPYFPTGTMEREEIEGRVATAKVFDEDYQTILFWLQDCMLWILWVNTETLVLIC